MSTRSRPYLARCLAREQVIFGRWWDSPRRGRRHIDVRCDPFYGDDGSVSGVLLHAEDTTERKEMEDQLRRTITELEVANQELKAFSDALAHDLRSPLLIVTNFSYQVREALAASLDEEHLDDLERISSAGRHMTHIIDDLRDLADVNRSEIGREETDLSVLGREIIDDSTPPGVLEQVLEFAARGLKQHGFLDIALLGNSGGNRGLATRGWNGPRIASMFCRPTWIWGSSCASCPFLGPK